METSSIPFPLYAFEKDDSSIRLIENMDRILYHMEAIDIENEVVPLLGCGREAASDHAKAAPGGHDSEHRPREHDGARGVWPHLGVARYHFGLVGQPRTGLEPPKGSGTTVASETVVLLPLPQIAVEKSPLHQQSRITG